MRPNRPAHTAGELAPELADATSVSLAATETLVDSSASPQGPAGFPLEPSIAEAPAGSRPEGLSARFFPGDHVHLRGLESGAQYNGMKAVVVACDASDVKNR